MIKSIREWKERLCLGGWKSGCESCLVLGLIDFPVVLGIPEDEKLFVEDYGARLVAGLVWIEYCDIEENDRLELMSRYLASHQEKIMSSGEISVRCVSRSRGAIRADIEKLCPGLRMTNPFDKGYECDYTKNS